jgi:hypothetical protein
MAIVWHVSLKLCPVYSNSEENIIFSQKEKWTNAFFQRMLFVVERKIITMITAYKRWE